MMLNKINPYYIFIAGFIFVIIGALLKIMHIPLSSVFLFWGISLKIYALIRFSLLKKYNSKNKR